MKTIKKTAPLFPDFKKQPGNALRLARDGAPSSIRFAGGSGNADQVAKLLSSAPADVIERAVAEVKDAAPEAGDVMTSWTLSTKRVDSYQDTIDPDGWDTKDFQRNPVVLFAHSSHEPPVGRDVGCYVESGKALKGTTLFIGKSVSPFADMVAKMVVGKFLNAVSVGFQPLEYEESEEREGSMFFPAIDFKKQTLREYSVVPIPANADALADGRALRSAGIDVAPLVEWAEKMLDGERGLVLPRHTIEHLRRSAVGTKVALMPGLSVARAPDDGEMAPGAPEAPADSPMGDDDAEAEMEQGLCPACGHAAELDAFKPQVDPMGGGDEPSEEEVEAAAKLLTPAMMKALQARGVVARAGLDTTSAPIDAAHAADAALGAVDAVARAEVRRLLTKQTGRLP